MKTKLLFVSFVLLMVTGGLLSSAGAQDFGDAPDPPYPTWWASGGPQHLPVPGLFLGGFVDWEPDGQPSIAADGDDLDLFWPSMGDDEDGVIFTTLLIPGNMASVTVTASVGGLWLNAWIDFNINGSWADAGDQIFTNVILGPGPNILPFPVPPTGISAPGPTYARFRYSTMPGLMFFDPGVPAPDGEVEDELVTIEGLDFGDAPDPTYPTILASGGAHHVIVPGINLGAFVDSEPDGQPSLNADGDDLDLFFPSGGDDEDGVVFTSPLAKGVSANVDVTASAGGILNTWIDFNIDGDWADAGEQVFIDLPISAGLNSLSFGVPPTATPGWTYARFRFSTMPGLTDSGMAMDGEVEDEYVEIVLLPPVADAGPAEYTASSGQVTLDGSGSYDLDGFITSWGWNLVHQTNPVNNTTASGQTPTVTGLAKGTYDVTLTVTDNDTLSDIDTTTVKSCFISSAMW